MIPESGGAGEINWLKPGGGGDLLMFGSTATWNPLLEHDLVEELFIRVGAGLDGDGSALSSRPPRAGIRFIEALDV